MNKTLSKISGSTAQIIQNPRTLNSGNRNFREKLKPNILPITNNLECEKNSLQKEKIQNFGGMNIKDTNIKLLTKNTSSGALRNSISFGSSTTNMASPVVNNVCLFKMENSSKRKLDSSNLASM